MKKTLLKKAQKLIYLLVLIVFIIAIGSNSGLSITSSSNTSVNKIVDLNSMALKIEEEENNYLYKAKDTYTGSLTGYGADCPLCGGTLACMPSLDVLHGNVNYTDATYGNLRIVASSQTLPCGTILRINAGHLNSEPIIAIVLDRGVLGNDLDLLTPSESYAYQYIGRKTVTYDVLRNGWINE